MAKLVNEAQFISHGVRSPQSGYSRVICCRVKDLGDGNWHFAYTPQVGSDFTLLSVRMWYSEKVPLVGGEIQSRLYIGQGTPKTDTEMEAWTRLLPVYGRNAIHTWKVFDANTSFEWTMRQRFLGVGWRFGLEGRTEPGADAKILAAFEITEG